MPFDGQITLTRLQKLERLRELLDEAKDWEQLRCGKCLMARMVADPIMKAAGFNVRTLPEFPPTLDEYFNKVERERREIWAEQIRLAHEFIEHCPPVFGTCNVQHKREQIDAAIVRERMKGE